MFGGPCRARVLANRGGLQRHIFETGLRCEARSLPSRKMAVIFLRPCRWHVALDPEHGFLSI